MKWANQRWQLTTLYSSTLYLTWQRSCGSPHALRWSAWQCCSRLSCEAWSHPLLYCSALCTCTLPTPCLAGTCSPLCRSHRPALSPHPGPPSVARCCSLQSPEHNITWRSAKLNSNSQIELIDFSFINLDYNWTPINTNNWSTKYGFYLKNALVLISELKKHYY